MCRIGGQDAHAACVADDAESGSARQWLLQQQVRNVDELLGVMDRDHSGLRAKGVDGDDRRRSRRGVGLTGPLTARRSTTDRREEGLALGEPTGQPSELARVAERLEVK